MGCEPGTLFSHSSMKALSGRRQRNEMGGWKQAENRYSDTNMKCVVYMVVKHVDPGFQSQLYHLTSYDTVMSYLTTLSLICLICKMEVMIASTPQGY